MSSKKEKNAGPKELSLFMREVVAIFFLLIGIFLYLSLLSFNPHDPSLINITSHIVIHNWGGAVGAYLGDMLLFLFGGGAYFIGFFFLLSGVLLFTGARKQIVYHELPIYLLFVIFIAILFQLGAEKLTYDHVTLEAGGLIGGLAARMGLAYLGGPGTYLLVLFGALLTFVWATQLSVRQLGTWLFSGAGRVGSFSLQQALIYFVRAQKSLAKMLQARRDRQKPLVPPIEVKVNRKDSPKLKAVVVADENRDIEEDEAEELTTGGTRVGPKILERADKKKPVPQTSQMEFHNLGAGYKLPPISLLDSGEQSTVVIDEELLKMNARLLEKKFLDFNVEGHVTEIHPGPVITMYEFQPAPGVKLSRIANLVDDLSLAMGGRSVRIVAPLPNKPAVGIEIPNRERETVWLKDVIADDRFQKNDSKLLFAIGKDIEGIPYVADLAKMPHLLVAGATGSGKSVSINTMILSILYKSSPEDVRLIMVDPKMLELSIYEGIPHLLLPVVTEPKKATLALRWGVREMERRYKLLSDINARDIKSYNKRIEKGDVVGRMELKQKELGVEMVPDEEVIKHEHKLPYIVIIVDELADLMMVAGRDVEEAITRLAQMARAAGIHLILATQRPSVDVVTGIIKANFPARISFRVSSRHDARTVLDAIGSERLLGNGDMLFIPPGTSSLIRAHGAFITDAEVLRVVEFLKKQAKPIYDESILKPIATEETGELDENGQPEEVDALYDQAVSIVSETKQASISMIQRKLRVGYNRAARMIEKMENEGIVSPPSGTGHRQVLVSSLGVE